MPSGVLFSQPLPSGYISGSYGAFYDTTTQTILLPFQIKTIAVNTTYLSSGVGILLNALTFNNSGTYNIQFSLQITNTHNQAHLFYMWFAKNGNDMPYSTSVVSVPSTHGGNNGHYILSLNMLEQVNQGDTIEMRWSSNDNRVRIETLPSPFGTVPAAPSVILTATQV